MKTQFDSTGLLRFASLKLAALGITLDREVIDDDLVELAGPLLRSYENRSHFQQSSHCPVDARIQAYLDACLKPVCPTVPRLPDQTLVLDRAGLARLLSLPVRGNSFQSPNLRSYRIPQGILHNPASDRRTTKGVFHIAEGGFPVPADKQAVPLQTFAALLAEALRPPADTMLLPFTSGQPREAKLFVSLLLRPLVCPATGDEEAKSMETRFFAPASLVSNLDFVESIFGNGGDPQLPENDAALDVLHWTGHTGCVILAPHLVGLKKKALGLPHVSAATERQRKDGMCWENEDELYNDGSAFKVCSRDHRGVVVTIIADNYYGYCKKEVKTQISFAANRFGLAEEEHAGGAIAFATYILGQNFLPSQAVSLKQARYADTVRLLDGLVDAQPEGYAIDRAFPDVYYLPEDSVFDLEEGTVRWGTGQKIPLRLAAVYVLPNGFRVWAEKQLLGEAWRLVGSRPRGTLCHKPCTVSGGGKSEISKSVTNALLGGPVFVRDFPEDMDEVAEILQKDFSKIYKSRPPDPRHSRPILSTERTLGSVIQLLTESPEYTAAHNDWLRGLRPTTRQLVFTVKRYYRPEWNGNWREHFSVDRVNGYLGHELKFDNVPLVANYLRVGFDQEGAWRIFKLRPDFHPAEKVQVEDDITASVVLPRERLPFLDTEQDNLSVKLVENCESRLFQRPDDAKHRGADLQAEADLASPGTFISNFEPLSVDQVRALRDHPAQFDRYTPPMKKLLMDFANETTEPDAMAVSSAHARMVDGKPSLNPRYLQRRPDLVSPREKHLAEMTARLDRGIPSSSPVYFPVNAVLGGRRNSPPDKAAGTPPLAAHGPIHYQELPELFMEYVASLTGKSPATTGFGSEGALTKGPFNMLWPVVDLNNALVSMIVTGYPGFTTSAGYIGPKVRIDHDVSLLVPEIWCRMRVAERSAEHLIKTGCLEKIDDFEHDGRTVLASRLGYRITRVFVERFMGRIFEVPGAVFPEEMLRPEVQDRELYAAGIDAIVLSQRRAALLYFEDGSVEAACPPLKALLHIMAHGHFEGKTAQDESIRALFSRESMLASEWYRERLLTKQKRDMALWQRHGEALREFERRGGGGIDVAGRKAAVEARLSHVSSPGYLGDLTGTLGADPFFGQ